jgi:opacity protein-like surface antigen
MNHKLLTGLLAFGLCASASALDSEDWEGTYLTAKAGVNYADAQQVDDEIGIALGAEIGHNVVVAEQLVFGVNAFYDWNSLKTHDLEETSADDVEVGSQGYGADVKAGIILGNRTLVYGKVGAAYVEGFGDFDDDDWAFHGGVGASYRINPTFSLNLEYTHYEAEAGKNNLLRNNNATVGLAFHF